MKNTKPQNKLNKPTNTPTPRNKEKPAHNSKKQKQQKRQHQRTSNTSPPKHKQRLCLDQGGLNLLRLCNPLNNFSIGSIEDKPHTFPISHALRTQVVTPGVNPTTPNASKFAPQSPQEISLHKAYAPAEGLDQNLMFPSPRPAANKAPWC